MSETFFEIDPPPGLANNGTVFQSKNRWYKGNFVRFFQGNKQPIGGWVRRTTTGATIAGTPNAALSWQLNDGNAYLAIGTTSNLYIVTSANVAYDITPATVVGDALTHRWQLDTFGAYLIATFQRDAYVDTAVINAFAWKGVLATRAVPCYDSTTGPGSVYGVAVTPERFLVLLRGADPAAWAPDTSAGGGGTSGGSGGTDGSGSGTSGGGTAPTLTPGVPSISVASHGTLVATATWTNTDHVASVRLEWSRSDTSSAGPFVVDGSAELTAESTTTSTSHSAPSWWKARAQYFNATGSGPFSDYSAVAGHA